MALYLPIENKKLRYTFMIDRAYIADKILPPSINALSLPNAIDAFTAVHCYGAYAWQHLTHLSLTHRLSDLDVLFFYHNESLWQLQEKVQRLARKIAPIILDGEIRFPMYGDCAINELLFQQAKTVLFKSFDSVQLIKRCDLYEKFPSLIKQ